MVSAEVSRLPKTVGLADNAANRYRKSASRVLEDGTLHKLHGDAVDLEHGVKPCVMICPRIVCEGAELAEHPTESETTHTTCR